MRLVEEKEYDEVVANSRNIIVQLSADWCGPCRQLTPILESVANDNGVTVIKVNIDNNPSIVSKYSVRSIPRILFIKDGELSKDFTGACPRTKLEETCKELYN